MSDEPMTLIERLRNPMWVSPPDIGDAPSLSKVETRADMDAAADRIERLESALKECSASYLSPPCTVRESVGHLLEELDRRAQLADEALGNPEPSGPDGRPKWS